MSDKVKKNEEIKKIGRPCLLSSTMEQYLSENHPGLCKRSLQNKNYYYTALNALIDDEYFSKFYRLKGTGKAYAQSALIELGRFEDKETILHLAKVLDERIKADLKEGKKHTVKDLAEMIRRARVEAKKEVTH